MKYEMANANDPLDIIKATQLSVVNAIIDLVAELEKETNQPGLTWEQLNYMLVVFRDKQPEVFMQKDEM